jgi:PIN domain nuclease of toxin-antitoxin system
MVSAISRAQLDEGVNAVRRQGEHWFPLALENHALRELPITGAIALRMAALPENHRDPADRFLIATAQENRLTLLTPDPLIRQYPDLAAFW